MDLFYEGKVNIQPELENVFYDFREVIKKRFSINIFGIYYNYKMCDNPFLKIAVETSYDFTNFFNIFNDCYSMLPADIKKSNYSKILIPIFNQILHENRFDNIVYEHLRISIYNFESHYTSLMVNKVCDILQNQNIEFLSRFNGYEIKTSAKITLTTDNIGVLCIVFKHKKDLIAAINSDVLIQLRKHSYQIIKKLDFNNYYNEDNFIFLALDKSQITHMDWRDNSIGFKDYGEVYKF